MSRWLVAVLFLVLTPGRDLDLDVQVVEGRVTLRAEAVPLTDVLDRLSQETGTKVIYEGPEPAPLVTVSIEGRSERETLARLLEGLGLNHVFQMDASGRRVEKLIINDTFGSGPATSARRAPTARRRPTPRAPAAGPVQAPYDDGRDPYDDASPPEWQDAPEAGWLDTEPPGFPADASSPNPQGFIRYPVFPRYASFP
jgi:hypothetical protein